MQHIVQQRCGADKPEAACCRVTLADTYSPRAHPAANNANTCGLHQCILMHLELFIVKITTKAGKQLNRKLFAQSFNRKSNFSTMSDASVGFNGPSTICDRLGAHIPAVSNWLGNDVYIYIYVYVCVCMFVCACSSILGAVVNNVIAVICVDFYWFQWKDLFACALLQHGKA